jgi:class 3 adenylate cyclase/tetratricopeptide (TPR) repeat protein
MQCWSCRGDTPDGKPFCANCGAALSPHCASCGAELLTDKPFCANCGTAVSSVPLASVAATAPTDSKAVAERRLCSVMFVDLVGFTPLAEKRDPEHIRELLSEYFDRAQRIIDSYGGTVEKFIGDAVMAVWGAPTANEDDAERAVRAALEVVASVTELGSDSGLPDLRARGGVVTGEVAITIGKVAEGMVLGDTVNSASRVQSAAAPGTVLVDESTWRASSGAIAFEEVGALDLKGKSETVNAWRALRVVGQRKGLGRAQRLEPPFVGRDEEIRLIKDLLHATSREQRVRLVSVTGIPGIGKSRLSWEFLKYVDGLADVVYWHQGRSRTYGEGISFGALSEMVRMRAGILEIEDAATATTKLRACLEQFVPDVDERQWIEPCLSHLLGFSDSPTSERNELFSAWRAFFERVATNGPTVLVFEDLQWADAGLIDFVESILEWSRSFPILVVTLSRPELMDIRPHWGAGQRNFTSLHLEPLSPASMRDLLNGFVEGLPVEVADKVLERAEGVPLYAVETIRMLVDRGVLVQRDESYVVEGELTLTEIPETLHALIASRLDALTPQQRTLLQDAGVVGSTFSIESLLVVNGGQPERVEGELREMVRKEFLFADNDPRSPERGQFGFVQGVIREVAVGMLARRDRSAKHLAVARYAESLNDEELAGVVAAHYLEAHLAAPDDPQNEATVNSAINWLDRAGQRAKSLGSGEQAVALFEQALSLVDDDAEKAALHLRAAWAAALATDLPRAWEHCEQSIALYGALGQVNDAARSLADLMRLRMTNAESVAVVERCIQAYQQLGPGGESSARMALSVSIAESLSNGSGDALVRTLEWCEVASGFAEELDDAESFARVMGARSLALFTTGRHREAVMLARGMAEIADEAGALFEQARARTGLSVYMLPDDPASMVAVALEAAEFAARSGHRPLEITNLLNIAEISIYVGLWDEATRAIAELRQREIGEWHQGWLKAVEGLLASLRGDFALAESLTSDIDDYATDFSVAGTTTRLMSSGYSALAKGDLETAARDCAQALALDPKGINASTSLEILIHAALWRRDDAQVRDALATTQFNRGRAIMATRTTANAGLAALEGRMDDAAEIYRDAIEKWRVLNCALSLALCELDLVLLLGPNHPDATVAKEARDIFTQVGALPFLQRLNEAAESD